MKALVVEDEKFAREYLTEMLHREFDFEVVLQAEDGEQGWELYQRDPFEFIIIDLILPKLDGLELAKRIFKSGRGQRVLALSGECDDYTIREVARSGILGFVYKQEMSREILMQSFSDVFSGRVYYSKTAREVLERLQGDSDAYYRILSDRELQVFRSIAQHKSDDEIAEELKLSKFTVRRHRQNAMRKLNLKNESSIVHFALEKGIIKHRSGLDWSG
jgi:DNA-binding NarL/FixJ family response regulator